MSFNLKASGDKDNVLATLRAAELDRETRTVLVNAVEGLDEHERHLELAANGHHNLDDSFHVTLSLAVSRLTDASGTTDPATEPTTPPPTNGEAA